MNNLVKDVENINGIEVLELAIDAETVNMVSDCLDCDIQIEF
ncbi:hypothetical protein [Oceanirhabdus sp. W0125-5]|nr:hypothetical protein [Oceanirhabdus sp. W0125-5]WBW98102.1 hypothetical protein OW730_04875 [Oceanirhabdus sp. W0125-5]